MFLHAQLVLGVHPRMLEVLDNLRYHCEKHTVHYVLFGVTYIYFFQSIVTFCNDNNL